MVKNPPGNAGDMSSIPGQGTTIPHAMEQLSPHPTGTELVCSGDHVPHYRVCALQQKILQEAAKITCATTKTQLS